MIAETLADLVTPQVRDIAEKTAAHAPDEAAFDQVMNDYLLQQKNVILLTTTSIVAGLGGDVNVAITAADNALSNNFIQTALVAAELISLPIKPAFPKTWFRKRSTPSS